MRRWICVESWMTIFWRGHWFIQYDFLILTARCVTSTFSMDKKEQLLKCHIEYYNTKRHWLSESHSYKKAWAYLCNAWPYGPMEVACDNWREFVQDANAFASTWNSTIRLLLSHGMLGCFVPRAQQPSMCLCRHRQLLRRRRCC